MGELSRESAPARMGAMVDRLIAWLFTGRYRERDFRLGLWPFVIVITIEYHEIRWRRAAWFYGGLALVVVVGVIALARVLGYG